jgi:hypothetical protein
MGRIYTSEVLFADVAHTDITICPISTTCQFFIQFTMGFAHLAVRELFNKNENKSSSKPVCPAEDTTGPAIVPFVGDSTFHDFASILSGSCAATAILITFFIIFLHASNYSQPVQQRQIIRIILLVPWVALFSFIIVWQSSAGEYLVESLDFGCSIALSAFLLLLCDLVLSNKDGFAELFGAGADPKRGTAAAGPQWLKVCTMLRHNSGSDADKSPSAAGIWCFSSFQSASSFGSRPASH